jgi:hypothetical protein
MISYSSQTSLKSTKSVVCVSATMLVCLHPCAQVILQLCVGNHELYMRRRTLDPIEVQQVRKGERKGRNEGRKEGRKHTLSFLSSIIDSSVLHASMHR